MAFSISDLREVEVEKSKLDELNRKPIIKSGSHQVKLGKPTAQEYPEWHDGSKAGVPGRLRVPATFYDEDGEKVGVAYFDACPWTFEQWDRTSRDSLLYSQLVAALGVKPPKGKDTVNTGDVIDAIPEAIVNVFGREYFKVPYSLMDEDVRDAALEDGKKLDDTKNVYLDTNDDELRERYLEAGLDSAFIVFSIKPAKNLVVD